MPMALPITLISIAFTLKPFKATLVTARATLLFTTAFTCGRAFALLCRLALLVATRATTALLSLRTTVFESATARLPDLNKRFFSRSFSGFAFNGGSLHNCLNGSDRRFFRNRRGGLFSGRGLCGRFSTCLCCRLFTLGGR